MTLSFPNPNRSFDETRKAMRCLGYNGMIERKLFVETNVFHASQPEDMPRSPAQYRMAFDATGMSIYGVACSVYSRHRSNISFLTSADFK